ncbi:hypothetical protein [Rathayibacter sp. AY1F3]|nr:hypothetical protein [Rathayibacter sp. AY1F3]
MTRTRFSVDSRPTGSNPLAVVTETLLELVGVLVRAALRPLPAAQPSG